uniref:Serpin domain-containing protein n=1 Tax=Oryza rufipogon TaxID=4529 RepID=A0A0E0NN38_ORYRU
MATTALADRSASGGPRVAFTSGVWCDAVVGRYKAEATTVDFKNKINEWTRQVRRGLIDSVLPPGSVGPTMAIVLSNAIYLKGSWEHPFMNTKKKPFYRLDAGVHVVEQLQSPNSTSPCMTGSRCSSSTTARRISVTSASAAAAADDLTQYAMVIFLPDARDGLRGIRPGSCTSTSSESVRVGEFMVPKFKVSFADSVVGVLGQLGLRLPFSP